MDHNSFKIDQQTLQAYIETNYTVEKPQLSIKIGEMNEALNVFLFDNNAYFWAYISAYNPGSVQKSDEENELKHRELLKKVNEMRYRYCEGYGIGPDERWKPEKSLLIMDINKQKAIELGRHFGQNAIVFGAFNRMPKLLFCNETRNDHGKVTS